MEIERTALQLITTHACLHSSCVVRKNGLVGCPACGSRVRHSLFCIFLIDADLTQGTLCLPRGAAAIAKTEERERRYPEQRERGRLRHDQNRTTNLSAAKLRRMKVDIRMTGEGVGQLRGERSAVTLGRVPFAAEGAAHPRRERGEDKVIRVVVLERRTKKSPYDSDISGGCDERRRLNMRTLFSDWQVSNSPFPWS